MSECIEFARMSSAREFRGEFSEHLCPLDDDKRTKTVCFTSDTPEHVIEKAEAAATSEQAEAERPSLNQVPLTDAERESIDFSQDGVSTAKARYLKGLGEQFDVDPFRHVSLSEIDTVRDAEPILERARRTGGTGRGGGAQYDDEATERQQRERRAGAEAKQAQECDHAEGHCANGDPEACEFLREACDVDPEEVADLTADTRAHEDDPRPTDGTDVYDRLSGPQKGAYGRSWNGYHGAVESIREAVETATEALDNANDAARAINGIRAEAGADPIHFEDLERANAALADLVRHAAEVCHECHSDHSEHGHDVTEGDREDLRAFVTEGGARTPVGLQDGIGAAENAPELPPEWAAQTDVTDFERVGLAGIGDAAEAPAFPREPDADVLLAQREPERPEPPERPDFPDGGPNTVSDELVARSEPAFPRELDASDEMVGHYEPTDEFDELEEPSEVSAIGDGRRKTLDALDAKGTLDDPQSFDSLEKMMNAVREISLSHRDGRTYMAPPEDALDKIEWAYNDLPNDEAREVFLNDHRLYVKIRAARNRFNDWMGKKRREQKMPSPMEAGPSNYPAAKARETSRYAREANEELKEAIDKIGAAAKGARQRALESIGSSVAEQNEQKAEQKREERRDEFQKGDLAFYSDTQYGNALWGVKRVNKKSVRLRRPHGSAGMEKPMSDGEVYPEYDETRADLDSDRLKGPVPAEKVAEFSTDDAGPRTSDDSIAVRADTADEARRLVFGAEWVEENLDTDDKAPEQFADDRQGTLDAGVEAEESTGEKQVTLTGSDAGGSNVALPAKWTATATAPGFEGPTRHEAGPYSIEVTESDDRPGTFLVCLHAPEATEQLASGIRNPDRAVAVARGVADRVSPDDVSVHKSDATVPQAAADAMQATQNMAGGDQQPGLGGFGDD